MWPKVNYTVSQKTSHLHACTNVQFAQNVACKMSYQLGLWKAFISKSVLVTNSLLLCFYCCIVRKFFTSRMTFLVMPRQRCIEMIYCHWVVCICLSVCSVQQVLRVPNFTKRKLKFVVTDHIINCFCFTSATDLMWLLMCCFCSCWGDLLRKARGSIILNRIRMKFATNVFRVNMHRY